MKRSDFIADITALVASLIPEIDDDYRCSNDTSDDTPGMQLTVGADLEGWSYQTGDNSFTGGAYGYATWGVGYVFRDSVPGEIAESIASDLEENEDPNSAPIFGSDES